MKKRHFPHETLSGQRGFTLVEALVVPIVIGILAGIAIPVLLSQREQARDAAAKSDLRNAPPRSSPTGRRIAPSRRGLRRIRRRRGGAARPRMGGILRDAYPPRPRKPGRRRPLRVAAAGGVGGDVVFGTRSASGRRFYVVHRPSGATYGTSTLCDDPWEEFHLNGGVRDSSW